MREHREETEIMRDSGKEDVRARRPAQGRQLVTEEAEAWKGRARASESQEVHATACVPGGGEPTQEGPGWRCSAWEGDPEPRSAAGGRQEWGEAARWEALAIRKDPWPPGMCPKITEWK